MDQFSIEKLLCSLYFYSTSSRIFLWVESWLVTGEELNGPISHDGAYEVPSRWFPPHSWYATFSSPTPYRTVSFTHYESITTIHTTIHTYYYYKDGPYFFVHKYIISFTVFERMAPYQCFKAGRIFFPYFRLAIFASIFSYEANSAKFYN